MLGKASTNSTFLPNRYIESTFGLGLIDTIYDTME
jgi:hypothetical protein